MALVARTGEYFERRRDECIGDADDPIGFLWEAALFQVHFAYCLLYLA